MAWPWGRRAAGGARTVAIGDVHGGLDELRVLLDRIPPLTKRDTIVFLGDYLDRGPDPAGVIDHIRHVLPRRTRAKLVCLRGNHEDAWLRVIDQGWPEFLLPSGNGCLMTLLSFRGRREEGVGPQDFEALLKGSFFPPDVVEWLRGLPLWYEDEHAIYVHAGLPEADGRFLHPAEVTDLQPLLWLRTEAFFRGYRGKRVVVGHTTTAFLPQSLSSFTPWDPTDLWLGESVIAIDTGCAVGGFLTAVELPAVKVYESRDAAPAPTDAVAPGELTATSAAGAPAADAAPVDPGRSGR
jgi:serine/threonine protein phosphatase 1